MRSLFVLFVVAACSHPAPAPTPPSHLASVWKGPEILATVPADTPYLFGVIDPMSPEVRDHVYAQTGAQMKQGLKKLASGEGRAALVAAALYSEIEGSDHWAEALGLSSDARFVIYGLSVWPVIRVEVKDETRVRELLARIVKAGDPDLQPRSVGRAMIYVLQQKAAAVVFGVVDKQLVASILPASMLDRALPAILGTELPAHSLRDATVLPAFVAKHRYVGGALGYIDTRRTVEALSGHGKGELDQLVAMLDGKVPQACQDDLARVATAFPRLFFGYKRLDARGFIGGFGVEASSSVIAGLAKLHAPMPAMSDKDAPLFALGAAINIDAAVAWLEDSANALRAAPFRCEAAASLNKSIAELADKLGEPLPAMAHGLRGFELVLDDATVLPPSGNGHLIVAGDHIADAIQQMAAKNPMLATFALRTDGEAIEVPLAMLGVPASLKSIHFAMRPTRAVLAVGDESPTRASRWASAPDGHAPLLTMAFDVQKVRERFGAFLKDVDFDSLSNVQFGTFTLDATEEGIVLEMVGTWAHGR